MTVLDKERIIETKELSIHVDYVCGLEHRKNEAIIMYKNGHFSKVPMSIQEFKVLQIKFLDKG